MPQKRYIVRLTAQEREVCQQTVRKLGAARKCAARRFSRPMRTGRRGDAGRRGLFVPHQDQEHSPTLLDGEQEATPEGLRELVVAPAGARVVELAIVESISHETIRRTLKKTA